MSTARARQLTSGLIALLLVVDGALIGAYFGRRTAMRPDHATDAAHESEPGPDWAGLSRTDLRIAGAFGALQDEGLSAALDALERSAAEDSAVLRSGHQLAHALGRTALVVSGNDASVIAQCRPIFASGCYHGVVESYLQTRTHIDMGALGAMCESAGDARSGAIGACMHGLGHGVVGAMAYDLDAALAQCDGLAAPESAEACHSGAFMEAINSAFGKPRLGASGHAHGASAGQTELRLLDPQDPYAPCDRYSAPYADPCWGYQGFIVLRYAAFDAAAALDLCNDAPGERASQCYRSVGFQLTGLYQRDDGWIVEQCTRGDPSLQASCAAGAATALVAIDWSGSRAVRFCELSPASWKEACYRATGELLANVTDPSTSAALCETVDQGYVDSCRGGASHESEG